MKPLGAQRKNRGRVLALALAAALSPLVAGCGWAPLYANPEAGPAAADLRAVKVLPISERIGQNLAVALRAAFNPSGEPTPQRYVLRVTLTVVKQNLGITTQGFGTLGRTEASAYFQLADLKTGRSIYTGTSHFNDSFDLLANGYSNVVAQNDSESRVVDELRDNVLDRLTAFFQRRAAAPPGRP
jgi:LPS-assembly lipoprotein